MAFNYYNKLSRRQKAIYRQSDMVTEIPLNLINRQCGAELISLQQALGMEERKVVEVMSARLMDILADALNVPRPAVRVLSVRPSTDHTELHGLYEPVDSGKRARISVWMRTVRHKRIVAYRTFLRTLLHEFCHHLDYEMLQLEDSFHTEGFFKRESSLFHQLNSELERFSSVSG